MGLDQFVGRISNACRRAYIALPGTWHAAAIMLCNFLHKVGNADGGRKILCIFQPSGPILAGLHGRDSVTVIQPFAQPLFKG